MIREAFLHYLWRTKRFDHSQLISTDGEPIEVIHFGHYNTGDGPDFAEARIRIGGTIWAGHVEMHIKSSDWHHHRHQNDPGYANVVLHVVWEDDEPVMGANGKPLNTLVIQPHVAPGMIERYSHLAASEHAIPCSPFLHEIPEMVINQWIERIGFERLERKTRDLQALLSRHRGDWDSAFFFQLGRSMASPLNAPAMEMLLEALPVPLLARYRGNAMQLEALLLGTAGLLDDTYIDEYPRILLREFEHLKHKHKINPLPRSVWNYRGLRPVSLPSVRLVQLAALIHKLPRMFDSFLESEDLKTCRDLLDVECEGYWLTHYLPDRLSKPKRKALGRSAADVVIINAVVPFVFLYGRLLGNQKYETQALALLQSMPAEKNQIIDQWRSMGIIAETAAESQALLTLRREYCGPRRCMDCAIGHCMLKGKNPGKNNLTRVREPALAA